MWLNALEKATKQALTDYFVKLLVTRSRIKRSLSISCYDNESVHLTN